MDTLNQPSSDPNQPTTEQPPDVNPKPSLHGKALLITFAFCILLFVALTTLLLASRTKPASQSPPSPISPTASRPSPTIDLSRESTGSAETANWKTYTNMEHSFSLKYPNNWIVQSKDQFYTHITVAQFKSLDFVLSDSKAPCCVVEGAEKGMSLQIVVEKNPNFKSYEEYKSFAENVATDHLQYFSKEEVLVSGQKAMLKKFDKPYVGFMSISYFYMNGNIYQFIFKSSDNQDAIFRQILSAFKFLE